MQEEGSPKVLAFCLYVWHSYKIKHLFTHSVIHSWLSRGSHVLSGRRSFSGLVKGDQWRRPTGWRLPEHHELGRPCLPWTCWVKSRSGPGGGLASWILSAWMSGQDFLIHNGASSWPHAGFTSLVQSVWQKKWRKQSTFPVCPALPAEPNTSNSTIAPPRSLTNFNVLHAYLELCSKQVNCRLNTHPSRLASLNISSHLKMFYFLHSSTHPAQIWCLQYLLHCVGPFPDFPENFFKRTQAQKTAAQLPNAPKKSAFGRRLI